MNPLRKLREFGQSVWYDNLERSMIVSGEFQRMITDDGLAGVTSNPTIFDKAINGTRDYDAALNALLEKRPDLSGRELFVEIAIDDIQRVADLLAPVHAAMAGADGFVSLEVSPDLAHDTKRTVAEARELWRRASRPNVMIKVPATDAGLPAIEALIADGINVNVTLLFSVARYRQVMDVYLCGLEKRLERGQTLNHVASVASFFVSRVDQAVDALLDARAGSGVATNQVHSGTLKGRIAIANSRIAYDIYRRTFASSRFARLREAGAQVQRLLWASTGVKNPAYGDTLYVSALIGDGTVNTMPPATYRAFREHGEPQRTLPGDVGEAQAQIAALEAAGIDLDAVTTQLLNQGVKSFADSYRSLLTAMDSKAVAILQAAYAQAQSRRTRPGATP